MKSDRAWLNMGNQSSFCFTLIVVETLWKGVLILYVFVLPTVEYTSLILPGKFPPNLSKLELLTWLTPVGDTHTVVYQLSWIG